MIFVNSSIVLLFSIAPLSALAQNPCRDVAKNRTREEVCELVNQERIRMGLKAVTLNTRLSGVAQSFAEHMVRNDYFSHDGPDGSTMRSRLEKAGLKPDWAGENIAKGQKDSNEVMQDWMKSNGHRANILRSEYKNVGIGRSGEVWVKVLTD